MRVVGGSARNREAISLQLRQQSLLHAAPAAAPLRCAALRRCCCSRIRSSCSYCRPVATPLPASSKLRSCECTPATRFSLACATRPAVCIAATFCLYLTSPPVRAAFTLSVFTMSNGSAWLACGRTDRKERRMERKSHHPFLRSPFFALPCLSRCRWSPAAASHAASSTQSARGEKKCQYD